MGQVTVHVKPAVVRGVNNAQARLRELFKQAIDLGLNPVLVPEAGLERVSLYLSSDYQSSLERWSNKLQRPIAYTFASLVEAAAARPADSSSRPTLRDSLQARYYEHLWTGLAAKKIVFAEGGTGLGKSRVIVKTAFEHLSSTGGKVGIFVPTISLMHQVASELAAGIKRHKDDNHGINSLEDCGFVIGRSQFIDDLRLTNLLEDLADTAHSLSLPEETERMMLMVTKAKGWLSGGALPTTAGSQALARLVPDLAWLADDLSAIVPEFPVERCLAGEKTSKQSAGLRMYKFLHEKAKGCPILLGTQTMLCTDAIHRTLNRGQILPEFSLALIDEAHELEEAMGSVLASDVSFLELGRIIRVGLNDGSWKTERLATSAQNALRTLDSLLQLFAEKDDDWAVFPGEAPPKWDKFIYAFENLALHLTKLSRLRGDLLYDAKALQLAASARSVVRISYSTVIRTPRLVVGPTGYRRFFEPLWSQQIGMGLLSGTLYVPTANGYSANYMRNLLSVPEERMHTFPPVDPPWLRATPVVFLPSKSAAKELSIAPWEKRKTDPTLLTDWADRLLPIIEKITETAKGGTLVLCCSYDDVSTFSKKFSQTERLICQRRGTSLSHYKEAFLSLYKEGLKPVWFAVGSAWTGLDLVSDVDPYRPEEDYLLTDLVIPRFPFRASGTSAQLARFSGPQGAQNRMTAMLFRLRQGIGRLIRNEGLRDRRLWLLDGRPWADPDFVQAGLIGKMRRIWDPYPKRGEIRIDTKANAKKGEVVFCYSDVCQNAKI